MRREKWVSAESAVKSIQKNESHPSPLGVGRKSTHISSKCCKDPKRQKRFP